MDKRKLHHVGRVLHTFSVWYFLVAFMLCGSITVLALRQNNLTALKLRDNVLAVDEQNGDVEAALRELRVYMYSHMNTSLATEGGVYPPIQLKYRYERLVEAQLQKTSTGNTIYADAQKYCEANEPESFYGAGRLTCIQNYIDRQPKNTQPKTTTIPDSLYKFDFASPRWSPDLAGWSMVFTALFGFLLVLRLVLDRWLHWSLHR
jgi:hypothetical protein